MARVQTRLASGGAVEVFTLAQCRRLRGSGGESSFSLYYRIEATAQRTHAQTFPRYVPGRGGRSERGMAGSWQAGSQGVLSGELLWRVWRLHVAAVPPPTPHHHHHHSLYAHRVTISQIGNRTFERILSKVS